MKLDIFEQMDISISKIILLFDKALLKLEETYKNIQLRSDVNQGFINKGGILIPLSLVDYKILFDAFEYTFFDEFVKLYKEINENKENIFTEFALRTLTELGFYRSQIIYSNKIPKKDKDHFKLLIWLSDYSSIGMGRTKNVVYFQKLLGKYRNLLTQKEMIIFDDMSDILRKQDTARFDKLVEDTRRLLLPIQFNLYARTESLPIFQSKKIKPMYNALSHILHGNVLLLHDMFSKKGRGVSHKLRVNWFLLLTGINTINHVSLFLKDAKLISEVGVLTKETKSIMDVVSVHWQQIDSF